MDRRSNRVYTESVPSPLAPRRVSELARALAGAAPAAVRPTPAALSASVQSVMARVQEAWPKLTADLAGFFAHLGGHLAVKRADAEHWDAEIAGLSVEDLYLAFACAEQDAAALRAFERELETELRAAFEKLRILPARREGSARCCHATKRPAQSKIHAG